MVTIKATGQPGERLHAEPCGYPEYLCSCEHPPLNDAGIAALDTEDFDVETLKSTIKALKRRLSVSTPKRQFKQVLELYALGYLEEAELDLGDFTLTVQRRSSDWMVYLNGQKGVWGCHNTLDGAIGYMLLTYVGWCNTVHDVSHPELHDLALSILKKPETVQS